VSFASNVSPFFGASYTLLATLQLTILGFTIFNFLVIVLVSAVGATLAKVVIYYGAFGFKRILIGNKNIQLIGKYSSTRKFYFVLFATALMPVLPLDDFIYIGAGATAASIGLMAFVTLLAKLAKSAIEIYLEFTLLKNLSDVFNLQGPYTTAALVAAFLVIGILIYRLDWEKMLKRKWPRRSPPATGVDSTSAG
jgi:hypothetical protein